MAELSQDTAKETLFDMMDDVRAGMLGVSGSGQHMQPMSHFLDRDTATLWFVTSRKTDLAKSAESGAMAHFTVTGPDHKIWSCMFGPISHSADQEWLDEVWSVVTAAWFDKGRRDPDVLLLHMPLHEAALWTSTGNPLVFGLEIARANMDEEKKPDVGEHVIIEFKKAA